MKKKKIIKLENSMRIGILDPPTAITLEMHEVTKDVYEHLLPLSLETQARLLQLIRTRKSGIITRTELENILFPSTVLH